MYQTKVLNRAIVNSLEYNRYLAARRALQSDSDLYARALEFEKRNFRIQCMADYNTLDEIGQLRQEFAEVLAAPLVEDYLSAEQNLMGLLRQVEDALLDGIEIAVDKMD
jgi:cell fate (sporulation/competence/biofilm development) regulator YlbF (YheA/YmcA/DUF963 family)